MTSFVLHIRGGEPAAGLVSDLFRLGPDTLTLTGAWCEAEGIPGTGHYSHITISRGALVPMLDRIADDCRRVAESAGALFSLHIGI